MWKETVVTYFKIISQNFYVRSCLWVVNGNWHLTTRCRQTNHYTVTFGNMVGWREQRRRGGERAISNQLYTSQVVLLSACWLTTLWLPQVLNQGTGNHSIGDRKYKRVQLLIWICTFQEMETRWRLHSPRLALHRAIRPHSPHRGSEITYFLWLLEFCNIRTSDICTAADLTVKSS